MTSSSSASRNSWIKSGGRDFMPRSISAKIPISLRKSVSLICAPEKRACSYRVRKVDVRVGGFIRLREERCERYSLRPIVAGRWRREVASVEGGGDGVSGCWSLMARPVGVESWAEGAVVVTEGGASETAFASMRCGSSRIMGGRCRFGRSVESGDDQPGWEMVPHTGVSAPIPSLICSIAFPALVGLEDDCLSAIAFPLFGGDAFMALGLPTLAIHALLSNPSLTSRLTLLGTLFAFPFSYRFSSLGIDASTLRLA